MLWVYHPHTCPIPFVLAIMAQHQEVANAFVQHFYQAFDSGAANLAGLYVSLAAELGWHCRASRAARGGVVSGKH